MATVKGYTHNGKEISPSLIVADWQGAASTTYYKQDKYTDGFTLVQKFSNMDKYEQPESWLL